MTTRGLIVITGAGASYDCASLQVASRPSKVEHCRPPLTVDIADEKYSDIQELYQGVLPALAVFRAEHQNETDESRRVSLEKFIRKLEDSDILSRRRQAVYMRLYLRHLLGHVSTRYLGGSGRGVSMYTWLVDRIERLTTIDRAVYINLNYDLFLDYALEQQYETKFNEIIKYLQIGRRYDFHLKPHGSVNWYKTIRYDDIDMQNESGYIDRILHNIREEGFKIRSSDNLRLPDRRVSINTDFDLPVMVPPILSKEHNVCPSLHKQAFQNYVNSDKNRSYSLLTIGFSAVDPDIKDLIESIIPRIDRLMVVDCDLKACRRVGKRLEEWGIRLPNGEHCFQYSGFANFNVNNLPYLVGEGTYIDREEYLEDIDYSHYDDHV